MDHLALRSIVACRVLFGCTWSLLLLLALQWIALGQFPVYHTLGLCISTGWHISWAFLQDVIRVLFVSCTLAHLWWVWSLIFDSSTAVVPIHLLDHDWARIDKGSRRRGGDFAIWVYCYGWDMLDLQSIGWHGFLWNGCCSAQCPNHFLASNDQVGLLHFSFLCSLYSLRLSEGGAWA